MKIGILGKISKIRTTEIIDSLVAYLHSLGHETIILSNQTEIDGVEVVIVLGGDGAILHAAVPAAKKNIKILGINYGHLGFLTQFEKDECENIGALLSSLEEDTCNIVHRSLLQLEISGKVFYALNEIAIQRDYGLTSGNNTQILKLQLTAKEGSDLIAGDGVLICTPTGSTAYSLSAGGAILTPEVPVFMMTPICAFSMRARPIVFSNSDVFSVKIEKGQAIIQVDGVTLTTFPEGTEMKIKKAPFTADFPVRDNSDFFARVRNKLNT